MPVVPVSQANAALRLALRRGLGRQGVRVVTCRRPEQVERCLERELVEAVVVGGRPEHQTHTLALAARFPRIPFLVAGPFRPDDAPRLLGYRAGGIGAILVDGIDEPAAWELVWRWGASGTRRRALGDVPRLLKLSEPIQLKAFDEVLRAVGGKLTTAQLARRLGVSREHLSREFAAGGAPNLKRVMDLARVVWAADLLANPGYSVSAVSRMLGFASPSHLAACTRRIAGLAPSELGRLGLREVVARFVKGRTRSRI